MKILLAGAALAVLSAQAQSTAPLSVTAQQNLVTQYCAGCHNEKLKSGGQHCQCRTGEKNLH